LVPVPNGADIIEISVLNQYSLRESGSRILLLVPIFSDEYGSPSEYRYKITNLFINTGTGTVSIRGHNISKLKLPVPLLATYMTSFPVSFRLIVLLVDPDSTA
jgi:hypothetical protein